MRGSWIFLALAACSGGDDGVVDDDPPVGDDDDDDGNLPPTVADDSADLDEGGSVNVDVTANDEDPDGIDEESITLVDPPASGVVTVRPDGTVDYVHDGAESASDTFTYTVRDLRGAESEVATVTIAVDPVDDPMSNAEDAATVDEGGTVDIDVLANDDDPDDAIDVGTLRVVADPRNGLAVVNDDGTITYTHDGRESTDDSFSYGVRNSAGEQSSLIDVTITVSPVNDLPLANDDYGAAVDGQTTNVDVLANDQDPDDGLDPSTVAIVDPPVNGVAVVLADGTVDYVHDGLGILADSFTYTVDDLAGATSNVATVNIDDTDCNTHPQWMPVTCTTSDWVWSRDKSVAQDVPTAASLQLLATGCAHGAPQPDLMDGMCSLNGQGWVSVDQFVMNDCDQNWYHLGGAFSGNCGGHNGDLYRHLVTDQARCYDY